MSFRYQQILVVTAAIVVLPIAVAAQLVAHPQQAISQSTSHPLQIASGDLLEVSVFDTPELSEKLRVSGTGEIALPVAGSVRVSGMSAEEAAVAIEGKLRGADVLKYPHVSVFIAEYATQGVTVAGEIKNPGIYPLLGSHGLLDLISAAGGVTPTAGKAITITHKSDPDHPEVIQLDGKPGSTAGNLDIRPGDIINVSRAGIVYVLGDVGKPGGFLIENNDRLTVLQAVALAQGTNHTAALDRAKLIRKRSESPEEIRVPLKRIMAGKSSDLKLADGDILFIPVSGGKVLLNGVGNAVPSITGAIIYRGL
jgi:polysaccharide export outer membrane protein